MKKSLLALVLAASMGSGFVNAADLFSAVGGLIDSGSKVVKTVTGDDEKTDQEALAERRATKADTSSLTASEKKLVQICNEYKKNPIKAKKRYLGTDVSAHGKYLFSDDIVHYQSVHFSYYDGVYDANYSLSGDGKIIHPEWDKGEIHTLSGKLASIEDKFTGCSFTVTNVR